MFIRSFTDSALLKVKQFITIK